jgi:Kef-type K+ transport system membrane component KefB
MRLITTTFVTLALAYAAISVSSGGPAAIRPDMGGLAAVLVAAALAGELVARFHLPRVSGYLLTGMLFGPQVTGVVAPRLVAGLQPINLLAVALIAFIAGLEVNFGTLRSRMREVVRMSAVLLLLLYVAVFATVYLGWHWLGIDDSFSGTQRIAAAAVVTIVIASFSPTVTIAVISDSRAAGPLSQLTLAVVIISDLALIVLFTVAMQAAHVVFGSTRETGLAMELVREIPGSLIVGALAGSAFSAYLRAARRELAMAVLVFCAVIAVLCVRWRLESLLTALAAGLMIANAPRPREIVLKRAVDAGALPVLMLFFVTAGASLHIEALAALGATALAVSASRALFVWLSASAGARISGTDPRIARLVWKGFVSQAGVTLGLTLIVAAQFPGWGERLQTLMLALIAIHEVVGPVLFRSALARAGEIGGSRGSGLHL